MKSALLLSLVVIATLIVGCGGSTVEPESAGQRPAETTPAPAEPVPTAPVVDTDEPLAAEDLSGAGISEEELDEIDDILAELDDLDLTLDDDLAALDAELALQ